MNWTDLEWVSMRQKVARLTSVSDLHASSGPIVLFPAGSTPPQPRPGVWVTTAPMTETVKRVDAGGLVIETVPRERLRVARFPVVVPAALARQAKSPDDLLRRALATGEARALAEPAGR